MDNVGTHNGAHGAEAFGFKNLKRVFWNLQTPRLYEEAIARKEATLAQGGPLVAQPVRMGVSVVIAMTFLAVSTRIEVLRRRRARSTAARRRRPAS